MSARMKLAEIKLVHSALMQVLRNNLRLGVAEAPKYINTVKQEVIYKKFNDINMWYTRILGLDEVRYYQDRVVNLQEKLLDAQECRRSIGQKLAEIRQKSNDLQDQIHKVKRQDDLERFLDLMKQETEVLKAEQEISRQFGECDRTEREIFTAFTNAVRDSHEKQRSQLEYSKYFGIILSITGSFLTFCYSTLRKEDLKRFVENGIVGFTSTSEEIQKQLSDSRKQLDHVISSIKKDNTKLWSVINENQSDIKNILSINMYSLDNNNKQVSSVEESSLESYSHSYDRKYLYFGAAFLLICLLNEFT